MPRIIGGLPTDSTTKAAVWSDQSGWGISAGNRWHLHMMQSTDQLKVHLGANLDNLIYIYTGEFLPSGSNLPGIASQFANQILGTANQLRNAEQKSANQKKSSAKRCSRCIAPDSQQLARSQSPARSAGNCWCRQRSPAPVLNSRRVVYCWWRTVSWSERAFVSGQLDREIYLVGPPFRVGRLSRNGSKLVDSLEVEEGTRCSRRVAPLQRGNGEVDRIRCLLCLNEDRLLAIRNYSTGAFVHGITGSELEKDNVVKHSKSDIHKKAVSLERQPTRTTNEILKVENNSLELTRIFKENIMTDCEREKKV